MNFELSEEQQLVQDTAKRFAEEDIAPTLAEEEKNHESIIVASSSYQHA